MATAGPMTRRGLPPSADISSAFAAANGDTFPFVTTGHPARACSWNSAVPSYTTCNGLGYLSTDYDTANTGSNWLALTDGNEADGRSWPSANSTSATRLGVLCMNASADPMSVVIDHRWR